ncbi:hypothetical protein Cni_G09255 [Canna indica]|uniref:Pentatricopeptide repeat-containing protein n=1 Tax=Canna indica TaxID=4628 RepID=A0AAQ3K5B5_9LILI|nr:hypothetical protein Cni_G09255 [Canna indica]
MLEMGCSLTNVTINVLINGYCKHGKLVEALGLVQDECTKGFQPDKVTFNTLVNGLCQVGYLVHALDVLDAILQEGYDLDMGQQFGDGARAMAAVSDDTSSDNSSTTAQEQWQQTQWAAQFVVAANAIGVQLQNGSN